MFTEQEQVDLVVIGAGFAGLSASKAYLQCASGTKLVILDTNQTLGGTWAKERLYEGLRSNNLRGTLEFPDYPLHDGFGVQHGEHLPGEVIHDYLVEYARHWNIFERIRFESRALDVDKTEHGWRLTVATPGGSYALLTKKLVIATGLTSQPQEIHIQGQESYNAPLVNTARLSTAGAEITRDPMIDRVTIMGSGKSAWDAVYLYASAGKHVDWVIRKSGYGPAWFCVPHIVLGPLGKFRIETLVTRRVFAWFSPCLWGDGDGSGWWRDFLHRTWLGRMVVGLLWWKMGSDALEQSGFNNDSKLQALVPDTSVFEIATRFSVLNYPTDILDLVRNGQVTIHRQDVSQLSDHAIHLADGTELRSDAFVVSTNWLFGPAINFKDKTMLSSLGIPSTEYTAEQQEFWASLDQKADAAIFSKWPTLATLKSPPHAAQDMEKSHADDVSGGVVIRKEFQPWRLYRSLIPPGLAAKGDRSLAFAGFSTNINGATRNEIAGVWIYAYMNDRLSVDPCRDVEDVFWDAALLQRFCFRRHPWGYGHQFPDFVWDSVPWNDVLLRDLGLEGKRKGGSWWRECFEPYMVADYRGVTAEWLAKKREASMP